MRRGVGWQGAGPSLRVICASHATRHLEVSRFLSLLRIAKQPLTVMAEGKPAVDPPALIAEGIPSDTIRAALTEALEGKGLEAVSSHEIRSQVSCKFGLGPDGPPRA